MNICDFLMQPIILTCIVIFIILGITKITTGSHNKDPVPNITMTENQKWIINKLRKADISKFNNNLWDDICPLCEKDMNLHTYGSFNQFSDHWCSHCGFITKMEVLA